MRKHSPRKWLHAILDLLPLVIIPIFAIYSHRHTIDSYEVIREKYQVVDFNQQFKPNNPNRDITYTITDEYIVTINGVGTSSYHIIFSNPLVDTIENHKYLMKLNVLSNPNNLYFKFDDFNSSSMVTSTLLTENIAIPNNPGSHYWGIEGLEIGTDYSGISFVFNIFDLTQMFGEGNEPTIEQFNTWFTNDYYEYTASKKVLVQNGTETLNNTDIGSQFVYALYTPIHDYFNLSNVGVFGQLYNWLQLNMFNGTAPISVFIVYHVILYEFIMDLIFLVYCVFMFIIDFTERLIDCLFDKSFGGGR